MVTVLDDELFGTERAVDGSVADDVAEAFALANVWMARACAGLAQLTPDDVWLDDGSVSLIAWLRGRVGMSVAEAKRALSLSHLSGAAPTFSTAWQEGDLSSGQVGAVRANVDETTQDLFVEHEAELIPTLVPLTVADTARAMQAWKAHADALVDHPEPVEQVGVLHHTQLLDGTWALDGTLGVEAGAIVDHALRLAAERTHGIGDQPLSPAQRRAEALVEVCHQFLASADAGQPVRGRRRRPHLHVVLDADALLDGGPARLTSGGMLAHSATARLVCDAQLHRLVLGPRSEILDIGRASRTVPASLWTALVLRDGGCRHPGCDRPVHWCDAHHVIPYARGGGTTLTNLVLKCRRHHTLIHHPGWSETLDPDGTLRLTDPGGQTHTTQPPGPRPP